MNEYIRIKKVYLVLIFSIALATNALSLVYMRVKADADHSNFLRNAEYYEQRAGFEKQNDDYLIAFGYYWAYYVTDVVGDQYDPDYYEYYRAEVNKRRNRIVTRLAIADAHNASRVYAAMLSRPLQIPPKLVKICEDSYLSGKCYYLSTGVYNDLSWYDIGISSFEIGSKVKLRVCFYSDMKYPCKTFYTGDSDLSNNRGYSSGYGTFYWNNNIKSLEITN